MLRPTIIVLALYVMAVILFPDMMHENRVNRFLVFACIATIVGARWMEEIK